MNLSLVIVAVIGIAIMVVGLLEWLKGWWKKIPTWIPSALSPILCLVLGQMAAPLVLTGLLWLWGIALALLALAVTELCYQLIVQSIPQTIAGLISTVVPPGTAAPSPPAPAAAAPPAPPAAAPAP